MAYIAQLASLYCSIFFKSNRQLIVNSQKYGSYFKSPILQLQ